MSRSNKADLPWVSELGSQIAHALAKRYRRPILFRQSGPYTQRKRPLVGIHFNDPVFHFINADREHDKVDFRFGFQLYVYFDDFAEDWFTTAGFEGGSKVLARRFFVNNIHADRALIARRLQRWAVTNHDNCFIRFEQSGGHEYLWQEDDTVASLAEGLSFYGDLEKKSSGKHSDRRAGHRGAGFCVSRELIGLRSVERDPEPDQYQKIAEAALVAFKELDFLYSRLWPRDLGPARTGSGQARALNVAKIPRVCSWHSQEECSGRIEAAHIKPDARGGLPVAKNLFWLCQFHHSLLDIVFKAQLKADLSKRLVVACVSMSPPPEARAAGIPLRIWSEIADRSCWELPLRTEAIDHLF